MSVCICKMMGKSLCVFALHPFPMFALVFELYTTCRRPEFDPRIPHKSLFSRWFHTGDLEIAIPLATQESGVIGSALGLVSPVSVHCE